MRSVVLSDFSATKGDLRDHSRVQVLRNAYGGGGGMSNFPEKSVTKV